MQILVWATVIVPFVFVYILISRSLARRSQRRSDNPRLPFWWVPPFLFWEVGPWAHGSSQSNDEITSDDSMSSFSDGGFDDGVGYSSGDGFSMDCDAGGIDGTTF